MGKRIIATVLILALLCAGGLFAKTEYDKWHAAQPDALKTQVYEDIVQTFPELDRAQVWESPQPLARIEYEVDGYNLLRRPLYKVKSVTGTVSTDITGTEEAGFTVDGRGYDFAQGEAETPLFASYLTSASVSGLFTDLQIVPAEGYDLVRAEDGQLFLTVRDAEDAAAAIRAALSKELVLQRNEEGEQVFSLQMTQPLMLSPDRAVVYARCESGEEEDEAWTTDSCYLLAYDGGSWKLAAEEPDQGAELPYSVEAVYEIPAYVLPPEGRALGHPYYVMVNRQMNTVTVFTKDEDGAFTVPYKAMICSTGRAGHETPVGNFAVMSFKAPWCYMIDGSYGQYATGFLEGGYLFHTICYTAKDKSKMMRDEYNMLGDFASAGCVRLQTADAKWIFDNCEVGTGVTVYDGEDAGPLGKPEKAVPEITDENDNGWDPTDPDPDNPWYRGN
jgi:hypothetical protein